MEHKFSQDQKILQKMTLTPKMKHSIQMLGMSTKELGEYIETVLASNPFLQKLTKELKSYHREATAVYQGSDSDDYNELVKTKKEVGPQEFLLSQIRTLDLNEKELEIAEYMIYEIDENGYLKSNIEEIARDLFTDLETAQKVLEIIQGFDPPGIGARDIRECLQLQLKRLGKEDSLEYAIVTDYLSDLAINDIPRIAKALDADKEAIRHAVNNIKALNPHPGSTLLSKEPAKVIPDLIVTMKNKKVRLELNRDSVPGLRLYNPYENKVDIIKDPEARKFLKENMDAAKHLLDNIKRREETMCRVADYILNIQKSGLENGDCDINALTLKDVSRALDLHPSTISRTVSNKYIQINGKVMPLSAFLSHGIKKENGETASKASIKNRIVKMVSSEDKARPLSDNLIRKQLEKEGIFIKRRTVAKYRESLHILPAYLRRKKEDL